jgi:hypothetical protein
MIGRGARLLWCPGRRVERLLLVGVGLEQQRHPLQTSFAGKDAAVEFRRGQPISPSAIVTTSESAIGLTIRLRGATVEACARAQTVKPKRANAAMKGEPILREGAIGVLPDRISRLPSENLIRIVGFLSCIGPDCREDQGLLAPPVVTPSRQPAALS